MYFCYVDESGDCGFYSENQPNKSGSKFFILAGVVFAANKWKTSLGSLKSFRKKIAKEGYLPYHIEFHCAEMIDPHKVKEYNQISVPQRWKLLESYAETLGQNVALNVIAVVINKTTSKLKTEDYLTTAITKLYQAFDEFLANNESYGVLFFDRANEKQINTHVRKLLGTGAIGEIIPDIRIERVLEDPIFRVSTDSMFIQSSDVVAYALKEKEFPQASRQKHQAHKIFDRKLAKIVFKSTIADDDGIIRA